MFSFIKKNVIPISFFTILLFMTFGYALYDETLSIGGTVTLEKVGTIEITSATIVSSECSNLTSYSDPTYSGMHIDFQISTRSSSFTATYLITITNNSNVDYTYTGFPINVSIVDSENVPNVTSTVTYADSGAEFASGEIIKSGESVTIKLKLEFSTSQSSSITVVGSGDISVSQDNSGSLIGSISPVTGDLRGEGTMAAFTVEVINTFKYTRSFSLTSSNENIIIVDSNGNEISSFSIAANTTESYTIYLMVKDGSIFLSDTTTTHIILSSTAIDDDDLGIVTLDVDVDVDATDNDKPEVGNVKIAISENNPVEGEAIISWSRIDSGGSPIVNYYVYLYNEDTGAVQVYETGSSITSLTVSGLEAGNYVVKVYGEDEAGNSGAEDLDSATTDNGYASASESTYLRWVFNVTLNLTRLTGSGDATVLIYSDYEVTLSLTTTRGYSLPSSVTVTMGGQTLTSGTDYTYDSSSGRIVISNVTGDITITASASGSACLIEGTKVRLADGSYKNIEDIEYDDLLMVYDHENGGITYEYPIWIEKVKSTDSYQVATFSDGSELKTYGTHSVFSADQMNFVDVTNREDFHVGSRIIKVDENGRKRVVTVVSIETVEETVNYYHVSSVRYHNILANDFLTTDGTGVTTYLYSFNDDLTWGSDREWFLASGDIFTYDFLKDSFPRYLYEGYRMAEGKNAYNKGVLDISYIAELLDTQNTKELMTNDEGKTVWMVTTSDDEVTDSNKSEFLREEGSYYTLPQPDRKSGFIGWLNTADNKLYQPGDKVEVLYGTHFIAQYKE